MPPYQEALKKSGYDYKLNYKTQPSKRARNRNRNVTFNPPLNSNDLTSVGHKFLRIVDECFPPHHCLHKIFNRNTLRLSYSTMPNVSSIIASHNKHLLTIHAKPPDNSPTTRTCNCRIKESCSLNGRCLQESVVYQAVVERQDSKEQQLTLYRTNRRLVQTAI